MMLLRVQRVCQYMCMCMCVKKEGHGITSTLTPSSKRWEPTLGSLLWISSMKTLWSTFTGIRSRYQYLRQARIVTQRAATQPSRHPGSRSSQMAARVQNASWTSGRGYLSIAGVGEWLRGCRTSSVWKKRRVATMKFID